jgi:predicted MPP superfamily phosphohydrolase
MNDLHVGVDVGSGFQNPFLTDDARETVAAAVAAINRLEPDLVLVPGDLTQNAAVGELAEVLSYLNGLCCPFVVCKGNHDRETSEAAQRFDRALGQNAQSGILQRADLNLPQGMAILVLESSWKREGPPYPDGPQPLAVLDEGIAEHALNELDRLQPEWLLVVSHYPLVTQATYATANNLKYGGHVRGGDKLLKELRARVGAVVVFCGHNHYHHILTGENWLQCATGALVEYPAGFRLVTIADDVVTLSTHPGAQAAVDAAPAPECPRVYGRPEDRELIWRPDRKGQAQRRH